MRFLRQTISYTQPTLKRGYNEIIILCKTHCLQSLCIYYNDSVRTVPLITIVFNYTWGMNYFNAIDVQPWRVLAVVFWWRLGRVEAGNRRRTAGCLTTVTAFLDSDRISYYTQLALLLKIIEFHLYSY